MADHYFLMVTCIIVGGMLVYSFHYLYSKWVGRRVNLVEKYEYAKAGEKGATLGYATKYAQSDPSGGSSSHTSSSSIATRTVGTQVSDWQSYSTNELDTELSYRMSTRHYALTALGHVWLVPDYHKREIYKQSGAIYDGSIKRWMLPYNTNLRPLVDNHPERFHENVELFRRSIRLSLLGGIGERPISSTEYETACSQVDLSSVIVNSYLNSGELSKCMWIESVCGSTQHV